MFVVGQRVETEYGAGCVAESSGRRVYIELDDGTSLNVATGTFGYERIVPVLDSQAIDGTYECVGFSECRCIKCIKIKRAAIADAGSASLTTVALVALFAVPVVMVVWFVALIAGTVAGVAS